MNKRFGQMIRLKPDGIEKYVEYHANPWPGVNAMIKAANISRYSIYLKDDLLFAYFEYTGSDFEKDMAMMAADQTTQKWWDLVKPLMLPIPSRGEDEFWADMEEIFHLD